MRISHFLRAGPVAIATAALFASTVTAKSQPGCAPRSQVLSTLSVIYDEHPLLVGKKDSDIIEVFSTRNGETFTVIVTRRINGTLCTRAVVAGENLRPMPFSVGQGS